MPKLIEIDEHSRSDHPYLTERDECYYVFEYTPRQKSNYSSTNNLILNLKKSVDRKGKPEYKFKGQAIDQAGDTLRSVLNPNWLATRPTLVPIPCSKDRSHPLYDDRMSLVLKRMTRGIAADVRELITQSESMESFHAGFRLHPSDLALRYKLDSAACRPDPKEIVLFDDMLTTGSHFVAAKSVMAEQWPNVPISGIFLARVVRLDD